MRLIAVLALVLIGCADDHPCDRSAPTCDYAYKSAEAHCQQMLQCGSDKGIDVGECAEDLVTEICSTRDCSRTYEPSPDLEQCLIDRVLTCSPTDLCSL